MAPTAIIISIGDELTSGRCVDTNSAWLSSELERLGFAVIGHVTVDDDVARLATVFTRALETARVVIITGGLGPTADDRTREAVTIATGRTFHVDAAAHRLYIQRFQATQKRIPQSNEAQFLVPDGDDTERLRNSAGVALGFAIKSAGVSPASVGGTATNASAPPAILACMPGVPREMKPMFSDHLAPLLEREFPDRERKLSRMLKCTGAWESVVDEAIRDLLSAPDPRGAITVHESIITLLFVTRTGATDADNRAAIARLDAVENEARMRLGDIVYGVGDMAIEDAVADLLAERNLTVGLAESCTAGLATQMLGHVAGVSAHLIESRVTYANEAKIALGVSEATLAAHGAVSKETAIEMADAIARVARVDCGVGITGIAGPDGGTEDKPVGLVWIATRIPLRPTLARAYKLRGDRWAIQVRAAIAALNQLRLMLLNRDDETILSLGQAPTPE